MELTQGLLLTADTISPYFTTGAYITLLAGILGFLLKYLFKKFDDALTKNAESIEIIQTKNQECNKELENKIIELINRNEEKTQDHIAKMENEINGIKKEYGNIKGDFATVFLQRDDFFRFTNGMENSLKDQNGKIDRLLFMMSEQKKN